MALLTLIISILSWNCLVKVIIIQYQRIISMLSDRKRFNYNINTTHRNSHSQKRPIVSSAIKSPMNIIRDENLVIKIIQNKENSKNGEELSTNKKLMEETAKQFKKLESDVQRVEKILGEKQSNINQLKKDNTHLKAEFDQITEQKKILIEAIFEKDHIIEEYQLKIQQLLQQQRQRTEIVQTTLLPEIATAEDHHVQTDPLPETCPRKVYNQTASQALLLQNQLSKVKQELFDARIKIQLITQQFQAHKQIEVIQQIE